EIPGERATPGKRVLPLGDLTVRYDTGLARFVLSSRSQRCRVIPVLTSGIDPEGVVAFLVSVGRQDLQPVSWFSGFDVEGVTRWPRYTVGRVVLFRRRWVYATGSLPVVEGAPG